MLLYAFVMTAFFKPYFVLMFRLHEGPHGEDERENIRIKYTSENRGEGRGGSCSFDP